MSDTALTDRERQALAAVVALGEHITGPGPDDAGDAKLGKWLKKHAVTIIGMLLTALVSVTAVSWDAGRKISHTETAIQANSAAIQRNTAALNGLKGELRAVAEMDRRLAKIETALEARAERVQLFWSKDWPQLQNRLRSIETLLIQRSKK